MDTHRLSGETTASISNLDSRCVLNSGRTTTCWLQTEKMLLRSGLGLRLLFLGLFSGLLMLSLLQSSAARVIYYNVLNSNQSIEAENMNTINAIGKSMLFEVRRLECRRGFMHDHHNRCRRIV
ncbi:uncharacterized protein LOC135440103 [Drosophila montana]|uniref:uncharacterized protein LOC135440103 n=1 Tax=Drosophila montana TaxID=40370 RepID=UPI00313B348C